MTLWMSHHQLSYARFSQRRTSGNKETITVTACVNAAGHSIPPYVIAKGKTQRTLHGFDIESSPPGVSQRRAGQNKGQLNCGLNKHFIQNIGAARPQILRLQVQKSAKKWFLSHQSQKGQMKKTGSVLVAKDIILIINTASIMRTGCLVSNATSYSFTIPVLWIMSILTMTMFMVTSLVLHVSSRHDKCSNFIKSI